jgi:hypothetical protein
MFHGPSLWWWLVPKLRLVDMLFFFFLEVISELLSYGPLNLCIKWKDNWIPGTKPLHESDEKSAGTAASALLFGKSLELRTFVGRCALNRWVLNRTRPAIVRLCRD